MWSISPFPIQGSKYSFSFSERIHITIGGITHNIDDWLKSYLTMFDKFGFTKEQGAECLSYFNLIAQLNGLDIRFTEKL
jgi:hypothetical protein